MKTLLVLRHAKSSWKDPGLEDHDRPLNKRGKKTAPRMGKLVRSEGLVPDLIISSSAVRARTTAEVVAEKSKCRCRILLDDRLYLAGPAEMIGVLREIEDESVSRLMIVGHNPGQENLIRELTGRDERFPTAALARIELPIETWKDLDLSVEGKLTHIWRPKELES
jgi:phosphohistidine phosphatase